MHSFLHLSLLSLAISPFFLITHALSVHGPNQLNHRHINVALPSNSSLRPRDNTGAFTYYNAGLGACGQVNTPSDYIVALNIAQWDGGSHCFETVTLSYGGNSVQAQVTDQCPSCPYGALDLTYSLFNSLIGDPNTIGEVTGTWSFASDSTTTTSSSTSQYTPPSTTQTPTSTPTPPPSTTSSSSSSTSTRTSQSTSSLSSTSSSSSSTTVSSMTTSSSSSAAASATASSGPQVLSQLQLTLIQLGEFAASAYINN